MVHNYHTVGHSTRTRNSISYGWQTARPV